MSRWMVKPLQPTDKYSIGGTDVEGAGPDYGICIVGKCLGLMTLKGTYEVWLQKILNIRYPTNQ